MALVYFNGVVNNNTSSSPTREEGFLVPLEYKSSLTGPILRKQSEYEVSIVRLSIPSDKIDFLNLSDTNVNDFKIGINDHVLPLPKSMGSTTTNYGEVPWAYRSMNHVVEATNRTLCQAYYNYLISLNTGRTIKLYDNSNVTLPRTYSYTSQGKLCYINVAISNLVATGHFALYLGTANKEVLLCSMSSADPEYAYISDATASINFTDSSLMSLKQVTNTTKRVRVYGNSVQPAEPLSKLMTALSGGTFTLRAEGSVSCQWQLDIIESNTQPQLPPFFNINNTGKLELIYSKYYPTNDIRLVMSPKLERMFSFGHQARIWKGQYYEFMWPSLAFQDDLDLITWTQIYNTKYRMCLARKILVVGVGFNIVGEYFDSLNQQNIIADFMIDTEQDLGNLIYSTDAGIQPWRRYSLKSDMPLTELKVQIYAQYEDQSTSLINIGYGSSFELKLLFIPK